MAVMPPTTRHEVEKRQEWIRRGCRVASSAALSQTLIGLRVNVVAAITAIGIPISTILKIHSVLRRKNGLLGCVNSTRGQRE